MHLEKVYTHGLATYDDTSTEGSMSFEKAYRIGRNRVLPVWGIRQENFVLSLDEFLQIAKPHNKTYLGIQDIPVERIIGTEDRMSDFSRGFYPVRSNMERRWIGVKRLMLSGRLSDAISVFEYGSYYFVRDGNHRVSVAKTNNIEFISAEVTSLRIPISLPPEMTRKKLPLFQAKYNFSQQTPVFDFIPEKHFKIACPKNWPYLQKEIFEYNKQWFIRKHHREPGDKELIQNWHFMLYESTMKHIEKNALLPLFPGKLETDIFCDMIRLWNTYPNPDSKWFVEIYDLHLKDALKKRWLWALPRMFEKVRNNYNMSAHEERGVFLKHSKLFSFCPNAVLPEGDKAWYRFLTRQVLRKHFCYLQKKLGRVPYLEELVRDWHENVFQPNYKLYQQHEITVPFPQFYRERTQSYYRKLCSGWRKEEDKR